MTEPYGRCLPQYRAVGQNEQKSLEHDSSIHPDCIPERRAAGKTPPFYPCAFPARPQQACRDGPSVQDQKHLLFGGTNQALHKLDQPLLVHGVLIDHKPDLALTADRRDHIDPLPLRFHRQHGRMALR